MFNADLALLKGELYAVDTSLARQTANLYSINIASGAAVALGQLATASESITHAEGLAASRDSLIVSFTTTPYSPNSTLIGQMSLSGIVSSISIAGIDIDGFTTDIIDEYLFIDGKDSANRVDLYSGLPVSSIGSHPGINGSNYANDAAFWHGELFAISNPGLLKIDRADGSLLSMTSLDRPGNYTGLVAVPAPSVLLLLSVGIVAASIAMRSRVCKA